MSDSKELENNIIYKLIVLDNLKDKYDWKEV
jgi:hypothetical protein